MQPITQNPLIFVLLGLISGALAGIVGIGGGIIIVPALIFLAGMTQQQAQGTSLAILLLPIGVLGAYTYYSRGLVDLRITGLVALGFVFGSLFGARLATSLTNDVLQKVFGIVLVAVGIRMLFFGK